MLKQVLLSFLFGSVAVFSYAPFHIWPLAFVSFAGLLWLIAGKSKKKAMLVGFSWGFGYFLAGVHWVYVSIKQYGELSTSIAIIILGLLIAYLALYPMLFALLLKVCDRFVANFSIKQLVFVAPILWQVTEFLRSYILTGFAWLELGYSQLDSPLRGYFPIIGVNGVTLLLTICCGLCVYCLYKVIYSPAKKHLSGAIIALLMLFIAPMLFNSINWTYVDHTRSANFALIQGNISQSLRWTREQLNDTLQIYGSLTEKNLGKNKIIIWSEASITDYEINQQPFLQFLDNEARAHDSEIAVGIIDYRMGWNSYQAHPNIYNTLLVLGEKIPYQYPNTNRYQKHHLVPFGEFTPFESLLEPIAKVLNIPMSSMQAGAEKQPQLSIKGFKFTTAICYEVILSDLVWGNFASDTDFLLTVSNDAWFGDSIGPKQHLQMAQARALEFGRPLIRSTNSGITAIIDHHGDIVKQLPQFETNVLNYSLSPTIGLTPYAQLGKIPYYLIISMLFIFIFVKKRH
jgi:apolipoprotein N-acyltransferase